MSDQRYKLADVLNQPPVIVSREAALETGARFYFTGLPCIHGHIGPRRTVSYCCVICQIIAQRIKFPNPHVPADPNKRIESKRRWLMENRPKVRKINNAYRLRNLDKTRLLSHRYRARKRSAPTIKYIIDDIRALAVQQKHRCANPSCLTSIKRVYHVDHIYPLARGGADAIYNIQLLCPFCNQQKSAKDPFVWAREQGRLL